MSYDLERREADRAEKQEFNSPHPSGDVITEDDLDLWAKRKQEMEEKTK